jgi:hypothetical protein
LRLAALEQDGVTINASMQEELAQLDRRLRLLAKAEGQEDVLAQLGQIRLALRPHLVMKLERRDRVAFAGSRAVR